MSDSELRILSATSFISIALGTSKPLVEWNVRTWPRDGLRQIQHAQGIPRGRRPRGRCQVAKGLALDEDRGGSRRGTDVHKAAEQLALGVIPEVEPEIEPYVEQYRRFLEDFQPEFVMAEAPVYSKTYGFAGTLDAVAKIDGKQVVVDMKTTAHGPNSGKSRPPFAEVALQLTLYRRAELVGLV